MSTPPPPKTRYRVTVAKRDDPSSTRVVIIEAHSKGQVRNDATEHFAAKGEIITHVGLDLDDPELQAAAAANTSSISQVHELGEPAPNEPAQLQPIVTRSVSNPMGIIGFILSLLSLAGGCFPPIGLLALPSVGLGIAGLSKQPRGLAIAACTISAIAMIASGVSSVFWVAGISQAIDAAYQAQYDSDWEEIDDCIGNIRISDYNINDDSTGPDEAISRQDSIDSLAANANLATSLLNRRQNVLNNQTPSAERNSEQQRIDGVRAEIIQRSRWLSPTDADWKPMYGTMFGIRRTASILEEIVSLGSKNDRASIDAFRQISDEMLSWLASRETTVQDWDSSTERSAELTRIEATRDEVLGYRARWFSRSDERDFALARSRQKYSEYHEAYDADWQQADALLDEADHAAGIITREYDGTYADRREARSLIRDHASELTSWLDDRSIEVSSWPNLSWRTVEAGRIAAAREQLEAIKKSIR